MVTFSAFHPDSKVKTSLHSVTNGYHLTGDTRTSFTNSNMNIFKITAAKNKVLSGHPLVAPLNVFGQTYFE